MFCRNCGKELTGTPEICPSCGAKPSDGNSFCQACGAETNPLAEICVTCGVRLAKAGAVHLEDMISETAYVKLGWVLGHKKWDPEQKMLENLRGEISERSSLE